MYIKCFNLKIYFVIGDVFVKILIFKFFSNFIFCKVLVDFVLVILLWKKNNIIVYDGLFIIYYNLE